MKRNLKYSLVVLGLLILVLAACQPASQSSGMTEQPAPTSAPTQPSAPLIVLIDNDEGPITPANFNTFIGYWLTGWVYDGLYTLSPDLQPIPALAKDYTVSPDGLTWQINLRDDVQWHDGEPFTAEDVVFSYKFLIDSGRASGLSALDTIEASGEHAVTIKLKAPSPFFLSQGLAGSYILPEHIWKDQQPVSDELNQFQGKIGTGAYRLAEIVPGESYTFEANPEYFRGQPKVDTIIAKIVKDRTQQINQLKTGDAQAVLSSVPPALVKDLTETEGIQLAQGSDFFNYVFYLNASRPPFDQVEVRKAISQAIDSQTLVDTVLLGSGTVLPRNYYHPDLPWGIDIPHEYNPEAAKARLDTAGLTDSDSDGLREFEGQPMEYEVMCDVNNPVEVRSTELIIEWLKEVGIGATQRCMDIDTLVTFIWPNFVAVPEPDYDMSIFGWSSGPQFQQGFLQYLTNGDIGGIGWANLTGSSDPALDALFEQYLAEPDAAKQVALFEQIQEQFAESQLFIPLMSPGGNFAYRPDAYEGWVYTKGTGIVPVWSYLP
jgi:peptide/nickel transport system substrate-binding protein